MRTEKPEKMGPTAKAMVGYLKENGPKPASEIAAHFGKTINAAAMHLRIARDNGLIEVTKGYPFWFVRTNAHRNKATQMVAACRKAARETTLARKRAENRKRREAERKAWLEGCPDGSNVDHWPVVQRVIPASEAKPLAVNAPRSVFDLANALEAA